MVCFYYVGHYPPDNQGNKGYTDPHTGGQTCKARQTICASLPDDCELTFAQMLSNFDDPIADNTNGSNSGVAIAGSASLAVGVG